MTDMEKVIEKALQCIPMVDASQARIREIQAQKIAQALTSLGYGGFEVVDRWQPIETAPKDGTEVLASSVLCREFSIVSWAKGRWVGMAEGRQAIEAQGECYTDYVEPFVTHWMPLPPAPEVTK